MKEAQLPLASRGPSFHIFGPNLRLSGVGHQFPTLVIFSQSFATCVGKGFSRLYSLHRVATSLLVWKPGKFKVKGNNCLGGHTPRGQYVVNACYLIHLFADIVVRNRHFPKLEGPISLSKIRSFACFWGVTRFKKRKKQQLSPQL